MINQFAQMGWDYTLVEAISKESFDDLNLFDLDRNAFSRFCGGRSPRTGEIACYGSHLKTLEWILSSENQFGIVCEDDIKIYYPPAYCHQQLLGVSGEVEWDMLYLAEHIMPSLTRLGDDEGLNWRSLIKAPVGTQFYAISIRLAEFILENFQTIRMPIDELYRQISISKKLPFKFVTLKPKFIWGRHYEKINRSLINPAA